MTTLEVPPFWKILPADSPLPAHGVAILLEPGAGWGDGGHPTTQLCLQAIAATAPRHRAWRMLDFGSGSGILAIAAARLGADAEGVEIDEAAIENAEENAHANRVADRIRCARGLESTPGPFDMVVANILRAVLLDVAAELAARLVPDGTLVLSGLVATDVPDITVRYGSHLSGRRPDVHCRGEWRALVWRPGR
jgi:ribosomal protein L11 methyltransferase